MMRFEISRLKFMVGLLLLVFMVGKSYANAEGEPFFGTYLDETKIKSRFVIGGSGYRLSENIDAKRAIVIVYTHGSRGDDEPDKCRFRRFIKFLDQGIGNTFYPRIFHALSKVDDRVAVFYVCHKEIGDSGSGTTGRALERHRLKPCLIAAVKQDKEVGLLSKTCKRARKIKFEVERLLDHNPGLDRSRIILSGGSAGGWASLLLKSHDPKVANGVIAFAPATHGEISRQLSELQKQHEQTDPQLLLSFLTDVRCTRNRGETKLRAKFDRWKAYVRHVCQQEFIARYVHNALVFSYENDPFNEPALLAHLKRAKGRVDFHIVEKRELAHSCGRKLPWAMNYPHACHQGNRFVAKHLKTIQRYLERHIP